MKKIFQYILMAVALVATASCSQELDDTLQPVENGTLQFVVSDFPAFDENPQTRASSLGTPDGGKTAWAEGDVITVTFISDYYGTQTATLTYNGSAWTSSSTLSYLKTETPTATAVYNPSTTSGLGEYLTTTDCTIADNTLSISFANAVRTYSRLRIVAEAEQELTVTVTDFTPADGGTASDSYSLTTDGNGNAYLYGTFAADGSVTVKNGETVLADKYTFTTATEAGKSYVLYAGKKTEVDLSEQTETYTITGDGYYLFTGTGNYGIKVESGNPRIVLNGASITVSSGSAIDIASGSNATIFVLGDNTLSTTAQYSNTTAGGIFVAEGEEPLIACSSEIHGIETEYSAVRILVDELPVANIDFTAIKFKDIHIKVSVSGMRTFSLYSDVGEMDSSQPFYPFGTVGEKGSWFIFGSEELSVKKVLNVSLKGTWNKLPDGGYTALYKDYTLSQPVTNSSFKATCEWQENSRWNECRNSPVQVFDTDASGNIKEDAEFYFDIADFVPFAVGSSFDYNKKAKGFYRIRLSEPNIGFGMDIYRRQFAEVMVHNSKAKERNQKPVPAMPQVPMIADAVLGYTAMDGFGENDKLYRINETNGYEIVNLGTESIQLLPDLRKHYLYLNLDDVEGLKRIRLYFSLRYMRRGSHGSTLASSGDSIIEYYDNEACQWKVFPTECILQEDSGGLTRSGFITLNTFDETNTSFIKGNEVWIRIGFEDDKAPENIVIDGVWLNCFKVMCENGDGSPLPTGTIASLEEDDPRVLEVLQPMEGYCGKAVEYLGAVSKAYQKHLNVYMDYDPFSIERKPIKLKSEFRYDFACKMYSLEQSLDLTSEPNRKAQLLIEYATGLRNSFDFCWGLTQYYRGTSYWGQVCEKRNWEKDEYTQTARGRAKELIKLACDIVTDDEVAAEINYALCNYRTVADKYPNTKKGKLVIGQCDNLCDYHAESYRSR